MCNVFLRPSSGVATRKTTVHGGPHRLAAVLSLLMLLCMLSSLPQALAAAQKVHPPRPINAAALRQALKKQIRVKHTGHVQQRTVPKATPHADNQPAYNNSGTSGDGNWSAGNLDGSGNSYSAQSLQAVDLIPGVTVTVNNIMYTWPAPAAGQVNNYQANGQILPIAPLSDAASVGVLGVATGGDTSGTATLTFTDGSTQTFTLGLSDWTLNGGKESQPAFGNSIAATMSVRNTSADQQTISTYVFCAQAALPPGKTLQSLTLPTTSTPGQLHIFAVGESGPAYNNTGTSDNSHPSAANFDGSGGSYSAQALGATGITPGQPFVSDGIAYSWPNASSGNANNDQTSGQVLPVIPVANASVLGFLGASSNGDASGVVTLTFTDGSTQTFTLGLSDWTLRAGAEGQPSFGNTIAASMSTHNTGSGQQSVTTYLFCAEVALPQDKTVQSVTLPTTSTPGILHVFAVGTRSVLNNVGTSNDSSPSTGNYDGGHHSYSIQALAAQGVRAGQPFLFHGVPFSWPRGYGILADNDQAAGQTIAVAPVANSTALAFLGSATNGASSGTATLTYSDGSTQTITLGLSDWAQQPTFGNRIAATMPYRNMVGGQQTVTTYLFSAEFLLPTGKTLQSVTLPTSASPGQLHVFAIGTRSAYTNIGISDDNNQAGANFDGDGNSYSEQDFQDSSGPDWNPGDTLTYNGMDFIWPNVPAGVGDNYNAQGEVIPVTPVANADTIGFVGAATHGPSSGIATLTYTDGSTQTFTLGMSDWTLGTGGQAPSFGNRLFALLPHRNTLQGQQTVTTHLFYAETSLQASKTLQRVTLPASVTQGQLHLFMIGTRAGNTYLNNVGSSDDDNPLFANLDGTNHSYSIQALEAAHIVPGQTVVVNGISFPWPASYSVIPDNYQAAGQTIAVTPVANATTLALLGAATNGSTSGTATLTYTDGTTQTFTLGFADWNVTSISSLPYGDTVAATMPYRNTATVKQTFTTYVFSLAVTLPTGKTVQSVTLPTSASPGQLHVFAVGTK